MLVPTLDDIRAALRNPAWTRPKGLVLQVNHLLHQLAAAEDPASKAAWAFRWNVRTALDDSALFLQPSEANLQALFLLAVHGEDEFAAPNPSWMLVGQACQQAKAIGLHIPRPRAGPPGADPAGDTEWQRRLCSFWSLFVVDKSVSLAFGRPEFLEAAHYRDVPLPDPRHLLKYRPHIRGPGVGGSEGDTFGQHFYVRNIGLAKMISRYSSLVVRGTPLEARRFRLDLERWYQDTMQASSPISTGFSHLDGVWRVDSGEKGVCRK